MPQKGISRRVAAKFRYWNKQQKKISAGKFSYLEKREGRSRSHLQLQSQSRSRSWSRSLSHSRSLSRSQSRSLSWSRSQLQSRPQSWSPSRSLSRLRARSWSRSQSRSRSRSRSQSRSRSRYSSISNSCFEHTSDIENDPIGHNAPNVTTFVQLLSNYLEACLPDWITTNNVKHRKDKILAFCNLFNLNFQSPPPTLPSKLKIGLNFCHDD